MAKEYLDKTGLTYLWGKLKSYFQEKLVSGTNIKTINNNSLLGSGNISISGGGGTSDYDQLSNRPQINSTTLTGDKSANELGLLAEDANGDLSITRKITAGGSITANHNFICTRNGSGLVGAMADTTQLSIIYLSTGDNVVINNDGYANANSETRIYGNTVRLYSNNNIVLNNQFSSFFYIAELEVKTTASISAHSYMAGATYTLANAYRPSGMTLVGIVGWASSNYRLYPSTVYVNGAHSIYATIANSSATSVSSGATVTFRLLYMKGTSA